MRHALWLKFIAVALCAAALLAAAGGGLGLFVLAHEDLLGEKTYEEAVAETTDLMLPRQAEQLASWCENTLRRVTAMMERVDADGARKSLLYCLGDKGVNVLAEGSFHAETVNLMGNNLAKLEQVVSSGNGNEVDLEQILEWNPEYILFAPGSCYAEVASLPEWQSLDAIAAGNYYEAPYGPYGWLSSPPAVQRYLGILWLGSLLYPQYADYDLQEEVTTYYKLFYGCDLTDDMYQTLIQNAM